MGSDERAIREMHSTWLDAVNAGDLVCLLSLMADEESGALEGVLHHPARRNPLRRRDQPGHGRAHSRQHAGADSQSNGVGDCAHRCEVHAGAVGKLRHLRRQAQHVRSVHVGYAITRYSSPVRDFAPVLLPLDNDQAIELFYSVAVTPYCHVTPDLQVVFPARDRTFPPNPQNIDTALVLGISAKIDF